MEGIGFDPQLVYFVLKPKRAYGELGGAAECRKKAVREPQLGGSFFLGGGSFFFFFFSWQLAGGVS